MKVTNIRVPLARAICFPYEPEDCPHAWERHLWHSGEAYCPKCGSFADEDPPASGPDAEPQTDEE